ncbi:putative lipoprotein [Pseudomonas aeruginosa]|nr:putative lipoprotein [Pseudomonas aeruginosa]
MSVFNDWSVNLSRPWLGIDLNLSYSGTSLTGSDCSAYSGHNSYCDTTVHAARRRVRSSESSVVLAAGTLGEFVELFLLALVLGLARLFQVALDQLAQALPGGRIFSCQLSRALSTAFAMPVHAVGLLGDGRSPAC